MLSKDSTRSEMILAILVSLYIERGEPISSDEITSKLPIKASPATVRGELAKLEDEGMLLRPHISSGCIPSYRAYRLYVDRLLQSGKLKPAELSLEIPEHRRLEAVLRAVSMTLSERTKTASIVLFPLARKLKIKSVHLLGITTSKVLLVIVVNAEDIREYTLAMSNTPPQEFLDKLSRIIFARLENKQGWTPIEALSEIVKECPEFGGHKDFILNVLQLIREVSSKEAVRIYMEGSHRLLLNPELAEPQKAQQLMKALAVQEGVKDLLLDTVTKGKLDIVLGSEIKKPELEDVAYIGTPYQVDDAIGVLSLIGPLRMNYLLMFGVLTSIAQKLEKELKGD